MGIPFAKAPYDQGQSRVPDLLMEQGRIAADRAQRSGDVWANALQGVGQAIGEGVQRYAIAKRDKAWIDYVNGGEWQADPKAAYAKAMKTWGPIEGPGQFNALIAAGRIGHGNAEQDRKDLGVLIGAAGKMKDGGRAAIYPQLRALGQRVFPEAEIWQDYDPAVWAEQIEPIGAQLRGDKPAEPYTLGQGAQRRGPNDELLAENPAAPPRPAAPPSLGSFEDYVGRYAAERGRTPEQLGARDIEDARKRYQQSDC